MGHEFFVLHVDVRKCVSVGNFVFHVCDNPLDARLIRRFSFLFFWNFAGSENAGHRVPGFERTK